MREMFIRSFLVGVIGLTCIGESSAFGRRNRARSCPCPPPTYCPAESTPCVVRDICECLSSAGLGSCQADCAGPCYGFEDGQGACHCGCVIDSVTQFQVTAATRFKLQSRGLTVGQLDQMLGLSKDHGAKFKHPANHVIPSFRFNGTAKELIEHMNK